MVLWNFHGMAHSVENRFGQIHTFFTEFITANTGHGFTNGNRRVRHTSDNEFVRPDNFLDFRNAETRNGTDDHMFLGQ